MLKTKRFNLPAALLAADTNIRYHYPINHGKWVVHPDLDPRENSFCRYTLDFTLAAEATVALHVSADNRFELRCDGAYIGMGPDRSDIDHWSFHSYDVTLEAGAHSLTADVHYLATNHPLAQTSRAPGFVLLAEQSPVDLNTGSAPWHVVRLGGVTPEKAPVKGFFVVGPNYTFDAAAYFAPPPSVPAVVLQNAGHQFAGGRILPGWKLYPTRLPEQIRTAVGGGVVRCVSAIANSDPFPADDRVPHPAWQAFVEGRAPITVPPHTRTTVLWDLQQYHTVFPELTTLGGQGARVQVEWAESCYVSLAPRQDGDALAKGNRDEVLGKFFLGNGDTFLPDGPVRTFRPFWWRAGRYIRIVVETRAAPLTLQSLQLLETRLPLENEGAFACDAPGVDAIIAVAVRGIQMCAHETYMDCPYYEQLMYVGDTRIQMLVAFLMSGEDRLNQRALELFDWSRRETGFVLERYPSDPKQLSATFAMIWVLMLRDYAWWRNDADFVRARLKGMRCLLEEFKAHLGTAELLPPLPGWSFMDWVDGLSFVNPPGPQGSVASVVNLLLLNALNAAVELEEAFGEAHLAQYNRAWATRLAGAIEKTFWDESRGLFADDPAHQHFSEHGQCLALLSGLFPARAARCFEALITAADLRRTTAYFAFYLLETFAKFGRGDLILAKLDFWKEMIALGLKTPVETPEPSRSDCHAWSSHPLFHMHASLAGIRPASPGFATVRIAPQPGTLTRLTSSLPHPAGRIALSMKLGEAGWETTVTLPIGVSGTLQWQGVQHAIEGTTELVLKC